VSPESKLSLIFGWARYLRNVLISEKDLEIDSQVKVYFCKDVYDKFCKII